LRVTLVFRRAGSDWRLVHRHADALVQPITMEQLSLLARGSAGPAKAAPIVFPRTPELGAHRRR